MVLATVPALLLATLADRYAIRPFSHRLGPSNAYRVLARRD